MAARQEDRSYRVVQRHMGRFEQGVVQGKLKSRFFAALRMTTNDDENQITAERRAKLAELRARGVAFPNDFRREHLAADLHKAWDGKANEDIEAKYVKAAVAGRMML